MNAVSAPVMPEVSIVVPVYNEEENLRPLTGEIFTAMQQTDKPWELIFVDDGSTDASLVVMRELAGTHHAIRYIAFAANCGQSAAFAAGFQEARGKIIITLDADLQNDPMDIPAMLAEYGKNGVTMVVGWRAKRKDTFTKRMASKLGNALRNWITHENIRDTGCSLKIMDAGMAKRMPAFSGMHRFFSALMRLEGAAIAEIKVNHRPRTAGVSKYGVWDRAKKTLFDLFGVRWLQNRHFYHSIKERKD